MISTRMSSRVAVVTGGNKGIGCAIVRGLCKSFKGVVYLTSRDKERGEKAITDLQREGLTPNYYRLDITDPKTVESFRDYIQEKYGGIDILVNNAATSFKSNAKEPVAVQAEETLSVNYFATLSTCELLFPILRNGARVVNISSLCGHLSFIPSATLRQRFQDPNLTINELSDLMRQYIKAAKEGTHAAEWGNSSYVVSKVGLTALTMIQQRLLNDRDIKVNAVHPGYVASDMTSYKGALSTDEGAQAPLYLALDAPDSVRGEFVWFNKKIVNWDGERPAED